MYLKKKNYSHNNHNMQLVMKHAGGRACAARAHVSTAAGARVIGHRTPLFYSAPSSPSSSKSPPLFGFPMSFTDVDKNHPVCGNHG